MAQANVTVGVKSGLFKKGLDEMRSQAQQWGGDIKSTIAGAFTLGAVTSFVSGFISEMARVKDLADRLGESSDTIQRVGNAAKLSGSDLEFVIKNLSKLASEARKGADGFDAVGISADAFVNAGTEDRILMLAKAYDEANGSQQKMADLMALLGPKGQDMLIMLSQGADALKNQMGDVATVSEDVVSAMADMDDAIESFKQESYKAFDGVIQKLATIGASVLAVKRMFTEGGSFGYQMQKIFEETAKTDAGKKAARSNKKDFKGVDDEAEKQAKDEAKKAAELGKDIDAEILDLARSRMNAEEKIASLKKEQVQYDAEARDKSKSVSEQRSAALKVLQLQKDIESGLADIEKEKKKKEDEAAKAAEKKAKDTAKAEADLAEEERTQKLEKMKPEDRIKELKKQQKELYDAAAKETDPQKKAEKKLEALKLNDAIDAAAKEMDKSGKSKPSVISSSLASVGGGGGAYVGTDPALTEARRQTSLLQQLVRNTGGVNGIMPANARSPF